MPSAPARSPARPPARPSRPPAGARPPGGPSPAALRIGALADATGTTAPTIRYYEAIGLLPPTGRPDGGQRRYGPDDVRRLTFIRRCRAFGFPIEQVRALVALVEDPARDCTDARDIGRTHLTTVRAQVGELRALERELADFVRRCETTCAGGPGPACLPLAELTVAAPPSDAPPSGRPRSRGARAR